MKKTGIEFIDKVLKQINWLKIAAYRRFRCRFGERKARILRDYVIFPLFGIKKINKLKGRVPYRIEEIYEVLRLSFHCNKLVTEIARKILQEFLALYYNLSEEEKARIKITFSIDDTYDPKTGKKMEGTATINDHHDGQYKILYNPIILYCTIEGMGKTFAFPLDLEVWLQKKKRGRKRTRFGKVKKNKKKKKSKKSKKQNKNKKDVSKTSDCHKRRWEYGHKMLSSLLEYCNKCNISLAGFELAVDNAYCVEDLFDLARLYEIKLVTRPCKNYKFEIDGEKIKLKDYAKSIKGHRWKYSKRHNFRYVKVQAKHSKYGECTVLFYEIFVKNQVIIKYLICSVAKIRIDSMFSAFKRRWSIEVFFRNQKQVLAFSGYSGRKLKAVKAHYLLRMLTGIFTELIIREIYKNRRWRSFFSRHITYGALQEFIIEHYSFSNVT